jgi:hypothetical protein
MYVALTSVSVDPAITRPVLERIAHILERQLYRDYASLWQSSGVPVRLFDHVSDIPKDEEASPLIVFDDPDQAGVLGWHTVSPDGRPYGRAFWKVIEANYGTIIEGALSLSVTLSHEALEMVGDPYVNWWADTETEGEEECLELCLAPETKVSLASGDEVSIEILSERGGFFEVISNRDGRNLVGRAGHARQTKSEADVIRVQFTDGTFVRCTPDHRFLNEFGAYVAAGLLEPGDSLRNTFPSGPTANRIQMTGTDLQSLGEFPSNTFVGTDLEHLGFGELGHSVSLSGRTSPTHPFLSGSIQHIFVVRSNEKVKGIHAKRNVTPMTDRKPFGDFSFHDLVRESVNEDSFLRDGHLPIAISVTSARPQPAPPSFLDPHPKQLFRCRPLQFKSKHRSKKWRTVSAPALIMGAAPSVRPRQSRATFDATMVHAKVVASTLADGKANVYDLTVPRLRNFAIGAGVFAHNCDRVQADSYEIEGVSVSNFLGPRAFREGTGPYDHMRLLRSPWEIRPGGYCIRRNGEGIYPVWGAAVPAWVRELKMKGGSRTSRRIG